MKTWLKMLKNRKLLKARQEYLKQLRLRFQQAVYDATSYDKQTTSSSYVNFDMDIGK